MTVAQLETIPSYKPTKLLLRLRLHYIRTGLLDPPTATLAMLPKANVMPVEEKAVAQPSRIAP